MGKYTKAEALGKAIADVAMKSAHITYNAPRGTKVIEVCIQELQKRITEIQPKKADPSYKAARYGSK